MAGHLGVVAAMDALYERAAADPSAGGVEQLAVWLEEVLGALAPPVDKELARQVRRAARLAGRLARYWADPERRAGQRPDDWRQAVDAALGSRGWEPSLEVARRGLEADPSPALFDEVRRRWPQVHFAPWLEGVGYEEWLGSR